MEAPAGRCFYATVELMTRAGFRHYYENRAAPRGGRDITVGRFRRDYAGVGRLRRVFQLLVCHRFPAPMLAANHAVQKDTDQWPHRAVSDVSQRSDMSKHQELIAEAETLPMNISISLTPS